MKVLSMLSADCNSLSQIYMFFSNYHKMFLKSHRYIPFSDAYKVAMQLLNFVHT